MKKLRETKNESCTVDGNPGQTYSETTGKESFTEPMPAVATTPVDFARVTLQNSKLHPDPGTTPAPAGPMDNVTGPGPDPAKLFHPQPWVYAKRLLLYFWSKGGRAKDRWGTFTELGQAMGCTRASIAKEMAEVCQIMKTSYDTGKCEQSRRKYREAQLQAIRRGTHASFRRKDMRQKKSFLPAGTELTSIHSVK